MCKDEVQAILTSGRACELDIGRSLAYVLNSIRSLPKMPESLSLINASVLRVFFCLFVFTLPPCRVRPERAELVERTGNQEWK